MIPNCWCWRRLVVVFAGLDDGEREEDENDSHDWPVVYFSITRCRPVFSLYNHYWRPGQPRLSG